MPVRIRVPSARNASASAEPGSWCSENATVWRMRPGSMSRAYEGDAPASGRGSADSAGGTCRQQSRGCDAGMVRTLGWNHPIRPEPWPDIASFLTGIAERHPSFQHMADIVDSVIDSGSADRLGAFTSMHDLMVVATPIPELPYEIVAVRAPGSVHPSRDGLVLIEHLTVSGNDDRIERPAAEAVPLFWRFMIEKYGVHPAKPPTAQ